MEWRMSEQWPKITSRQIIPVSFWMEVIARGVEFSPGNTEIYHAVKQQDYLAIVARTRSGHFPLVRQYRPALEAFTWELPAGLVDPGEDPAEGCRRELLEETGYPTRAIHPLGVAAPGERIGDFVPEPGLSVRMVTAAELVDMIKSGEFVSQLHLGALMLAEVRSFISLR
jgi:ADP-ribose pyrophosphatase